MKWRSAGFIGGSISRRFTALVLLIVTALVAAVVLTVYYLLAYKYGGRIEAEAGHAVVAAVISEILADMLVAASVVAFAAVLIVVFIVRKKISGPVRSLTAAANSISLGHLDTVIPSYSKNRDEIAVLSAALSRMVEQLRIHTHRQAQAQEVTAVRLQFGLFAKEANSLPQAFRMALAALRCRYEPLRIALVYTSPTPVYALHYNKDGDGEGAIIDSAAFPGHSEVMSLLAGKRMVFLNAFVAEKKSISFAGDKTEMICLVSLVVERRLPGYIIVESEDREKLSVIKEEGFLLQVADELSGWISNNRDAPMSTAGPEPLPVKAEARQAGEVDAGETRAKAAPAPETPPPSEKQKSALAALREIDELDVDAALKAIGGLEDVYERSVRLFVKLLPETLSKTDELSGTDIKAFAIEIHGLKGSLTNMGAPALGETAARIEDAAKSNDTAYCEKNYPPFKETLADFHKRLIAALPSQEITKKYGNVKFLKGFLEKAKKSADEFDAFEAKNIMREAAGFMYNPEADSLVNEITESLERFDCANAVQLMNKLGGMLK